MKRSRELEIQDTIKGFLESNQLFPFSIICTFCQLEGVVGVTFWSSVDVSRLLDILDYKSQCDKSGYCIYEKENTIVFTGMALLNLYVNHGRKNI